MVRQVTPRLLRAEVLRVHSRRRDQYAQDRQYEDWQLGRLE